MYEIQTSFNIEIVRYESSVINIVISIISNDTFYEYFQIYLDLDCNITEARTNSNYANREFHLGVEKDKGKKIADIVSVIIRSASLNHTCQAEYIDLTRTRSNFHQIKIAEKYNLTKLTQMNFSVDNTTRRIVIDIDGNVSNALLRIPTSKFLFKNI